MLIPLALVGLGIIAYGCSEGSGYATLPPRPDAEPPPPDATPDIIQEASVDASIDASKDLFVMDNPEPSPEVGLDAEPEVGPEAGPETGIDASIDLTPDRMPEEVGVDTPDVFDSFLPDLSPVDPRRVLTLGSPTCGPIRRFASSGSTLWLTCPQTWFSNTVGVGLRNLTTVPTGQSLGDIVPLNSNRIALLTGAAIAVDDGRATPTTPQPMFSDYPVGHSLTGASSASTIGASGFLAVPTQNLMTATQGSLLLYLYNAATGTLPPEPPITISTPQPNPTGVFLTSTSPTEHQVVIVNRGTTGVNPSVRSFQVTLSTPPTTPVVVETGSVSWPDFMPSIMPPARIGNQVAMIGNRSGITTIALVNFLGGSSQFIVPAYNPTAVISWSGNYVFGDNRGTLYVINTDGRTLESLQVAPPDRIEPIVTMTTIPGYLLVGTQGSVGNGRMYRVSPAS